MDCLAGDGAYTLSELAAELSRQTGKAGTYLNLSESALLEAGLPEGFATLLADSDTGAFHGHLFDASGDLSTLIGRPTTPIAETVAAALD